MGRPPIGKRPMTATEHQRRYRKKLARQKKLENPKLKEKVAEARPARGRTRRESNWRSRTNAMA
jgi:hypothetical protein